MRLLVIISFLFLISAGGYAQSKGFTISGTVVDSSTNSGVELATIAIKAKGSETILNATTADATGKFELPDTKSGKYDLVVAFMGYNTKTLAVEVKADVKLGKISISSAVSTLKAAVITAERREITVDAEKTVPAYACGLYTDPVFFGTGFGAWTGVRLREHR